MRAQRQLKVKKMVLSAVFSAISVVILWIGGILGDLDLTFAAFSSLIIVLSVVEMGTGYAFLVYCVTSTLCLILFPTFFITPMYVLFVGIFPIIKYYFEKLNKLVAFLLKIGFTNLMLAVLLYLGSYIFGIKDDTAAWIIILLGNIAFVLFDYALTGLVAIYEAKIRKKIGIKKMLK